jgi:hypothetical protein
MSVFSSLKNTLPNSFALLFKTVKHNFLRVVIIFAAYWAALVFGCEYSNFSYIDASGLFRWLVLLSFISVSAPLFAGKKFSWLKVFPHWKFILFSILLTAFAFAFSLPLLFAVHLITGAILPLFLAPAFVFICSVLLEALMAVYVLIMIFAAFDFNRKAAIDDPLINSVKIIFSNKLGVYFLALVYIILAAARPGLVKPGIISYPGYIISGFFLMAVYNTLNLKEEERPDKGNENIEDVKTEDLKLPKINISF